MSDLHEVLLSMKIEMEIGSDPLHKKKKKSDSQLRVSHIMCGKKRRERKRVEEKLKTV